MLHAVGFLIDHRYVPDEYRKHDDATVLQNKIKQVRLITAQEIVNNRITVQLYVYFPENASD